jgi:hypothetical protein
MPAINTDRLAAITTLARGNHEADSAKMCAMEAVAYIAGEPWSDAPACASPVIAAFVRRWNDTLPDADRTRLLLPLVPEIVGTRTTDDDEEIRAWMVTDWLVRVQAPAWLRLAGLTEHARALKSCARIVDAVTAQAGQPKIDAARDAAWAQAGQPKIDASRAAARDAAWSAAWDAAWSAVRAAAGAAAWDAARDAARDAAWSAAGAAAGAAAGDAARVDLAPTVAMLQASAQDLVRRMCAVGRSPEEASDDA